MNPELYLTIILISCFVVFITSFILNSGRIKAEFSMAVKQDITSEQMKKAEEKESRFLLKNNLKPGEDISVIGQALKIRVNDIEEQISGQAHLGSPDINGIMTVTFRRGLSQQEKTFAFAHECGHIINEDAVPIDRPDGKHKAYVEQAADYVAAALLMPLDDVYHYLSINNYQNASPQKRTRLLKGLCRTYNVDDIIALRRIREVYTLKNS